MPKPNRVVFFESKIPEEIIETYPDLVGVHEYKFKVNHYVFEKHIEQSLKRKNFVLFHSSNSDFLKFLFWKKIDGMKFRIEEDPKEVTKHLKIDNYLTKMHNSERVSELKALHELMKNQKEKLAELRYEYTQIGRALDNNHFKATEMEEKLSLELIDKMLRLYGVRK
jgi:hypothetical protein